MPALLCFAVLHLALVCVLGRVKNVHRPFATDRAFDDDRQLSPDGLRHRDKNAGVVEVLLVLWPALAFLVALLCTGALLEWESGEE